MGFGECNTPCYKRVIQQTQVAVSSSAQTQPITIMMGMMITCMNIMDRTVVQVRS